MPMETGGPANPGNPASITHPPKELCLTVRFRSVTIKCPIIFRVGIKQGETDTIQALVLAFADKAFFHFLHSFISYYSRLDPNNPMTRGKVSVAAPPPKDHALRTKRVKLDWWSVKIESLERDRDLFELLREMAAAAGVKEDERPVLLLDIDMPSTVLFWFEGMGRG